MKRFLKYLVPLAVVAWLATALYAVDVSEFAYVTRFGEPVVVHDGRTAAGLHLKWPWPIDAVMRIDGRVQSFDLPAVESLTRDAANRTVDKTIAADAFVAWSIPDADAADRFVRTLGTPERARLVLSPQVAGRVATVIGTMPLDDLVGATDDAGRAARSARLNSALRADGFAEKWRTEYGIELIDLRLRRLSYPEAVRQSIFERIRSERGKKVAEYEAEGRKLAAEILANADKQARTIEAEARATKVRTEGEADAKADAIRNEAHAKDPEFYAFLQKLKSYQQLLGDTRDILLLSSKHPLFDALLAPPKGPAK
jgi:membrane protease subunit HflC